MRRRKGFPASRQDGLLIERIDSETVVYDVESKEAHCLSPVAAAVFARCDGRTSEAELAEQVLQDLGGSADEETVEAAMDQLEARALLSRPEPGLSRRDMVRQTAALTAAAVTVPLITTVGTAQAAGCGQRCNNDRDCTQTGCGNCVHNPGLGHKTCVA